MIKLCTVWVTRGADGKVAFDTFKPEDGETGDTVILANETFAFNKLTDAVVPVIDLCRLAYPLNPRENVAMWLEGGEAPSGEALYRLWKKLEEHLLAYPVWALEVLAQLYRDLEERGLCLLFSDLSGRVEGRHPRKYAREDAKRGVIDWRTSFPVRNVMRHAGRKLPTLEDCTPLDPVTTAGYFETGGAFARLMPGYESRKGQVEMARAVADAFNSGKHLLVEAGTGVGKSLAYLVPAASWALLNDVPVVVSTNTRNLQTQLVEKDLPQVRKALDEAVGGDEGTVPLRTALLKGRSNYLCLRRFADLAEQSVYELERPELRQFAETVAWACQTNDGDLDQFAGGGRSDAQFLSRLTSTGEECPGRSCPHYYRCFLQKARAVASNAHIVVANHALVFAEAQMPGSILPPHAQIVFDEAHNLEAAATNHLKIELSMNGVSRMLRRMGKVKSSRRDGMLERMERYVLRTSNLLPSDEARQAFAEAVRMAKRALDRIRAKAESFFKTAEHLIAEGGDAVRFRCVPNGEQAPEGGGYERQSFRGGRFLALSELEWDEREAEASKTALLDAVASCATAFTAIVAVLDAPRQAGELPLYADQAVLLEGALKTFQEFAFNVAFVFAANVDSYVFWAERETFSGHGKHGGVRLNAAPLSIGESLKKLLFETKSSVVMCSATLRVGGSFSYIGRRLGLGLIDQERISTCLAESPFNYLTQCRVLATDFMPEPKGTSSAGMYSEQLSALMADLFPLTRGRAMGLFTSYEMMRQVAGLLEVPLSDAGIRLLVHNVDGTRDRITRLFREGNGASVLFGVHSFWEGVDVAGEALSCVVLARLPFGALGDPVFEARCEQIDQAGGSSFRELSLPQAVIRFRQGFGRLIRTKSDRGVVVIADPRIIRAGYGAVFRKSLPCPVAKVSDRETLLREVRDFFNP